MSVSKSNTSAAGISVPGLCDVSAAPEVVPATARELRKALISDEMLDAALDRVDADGLQLTGEGGFLPELIKAVLERGLAGRADRAPGL